MNNHTTSVPDAAPRPPIETPREERASESYWRAVAQQRPDWGWTGSNPARRAIDAAKQIERAAQYGIPAQAAHEAYDEARAAQVTS